MSKDEVDCAYRWFLKHAAKLILFEGVKCVYYRHFGSHPAIEEIGCIAAFKYGIFKPYKLVEE